MTETDTDVPDDLVPPEQLIYLPVVNAAEGNSARLSLRVYRICAIVRAAPNLGVLKNDVMVVVPWETWEWGVVPDSVRKRAPDDRLPLLVDRSVMDGYTDSLTEALLAIIAKSTSNGLGVRRMLLKERRPSLCELPDDDRE